MREIEDDSRVVGSRSRCCRVRSPRLTLNGIVRSDDGEKGEQARTLARASVRTDSFMIGDQPHLEPGGQVSDDFSGRPAHPLLEVFCRVRRACSKPNLDLGASFFLLGSHLEKIASK